MKRHDDRQRSDRFAVTRPVHHTPPAPLFQTEKQLTARADRPLRDPAHTVAFTTAVAVGGAGSVHRRTGIKTARTLPTATVPDRSPPATNCAQNPPPALAAIQTHCCSDHRHAWRCNADRSRRRSREEGGSNDTQRTARAHGVSPGEPGESHAARVHKLTLTGRPRCGRESSQGAVSLRNTLKIKLMEKQ